MGELRENSNVAKARSRPRQIGTTERTVTEVALDCVMQFPR